VTQRIDVVYRIDGTTHNATYTADAAAITMFRDGRTYLELTAGADHHGTVIDVMYRRAEMVLRRPTDEHPEGTAR
jgi:hypothetical protein